MGGKGSFWSRRIFLRVVGDNVLALGLNSDSILSTFGLGVPILGVDNLFSFSFDDTSLLDLSFGLALDKEVRLHLNSFWFQTKIVQVAFGLSGGMVCPLKTLMELEDHKYFYDGLILQYWSLQLQIF